MLKSWVFPRGAGEKYIDYVDQVAVDCVAVDTAVSSTWAAENLQPKMCVQGNLDQSLLVTGGDKLITENQTCGLKRSRTARIFSIWATVLRLMRPPDHVTQMIEAIRG